jgi:hypothetical protein
LKRAYRLSSERGARLFFFLFICCFMPEIRVFWSYLRYNSKLPTLKQMLHQILRKLNASLDQLDSTGTCLLGESAIPVPRIRRRQDTAVEKALESFEKIEKLIFSGLVTNFTEDPSHELYKTFDHIIRTFDTTPSETDSSDSIDIVEAFRTAVDKYDRPFFKEIVLGLLFHYWGDDWEPDNHDNMVVSTFKTDLRTCLDFLTKMFLGSENMGESDLREILKEKKCNLLLLVKNTIHLFVDLYDPDSIDADTIENFVESVYRETGTTNKMDIFKKLVFIRVFVYFTTEEDTFLDINPRNEETRLMALYFKSVKNEISMNLCKDSEDPFGLQNLDKLKRNVHFIYSLYDIGSSYDLQRFDYLVNHALSQKAGIPEENLIHFVLKLVVEKCIKMETTGSKDPEDMLYDAMKDIFKEKEADRVILLRKLLVYFFDRSEFIPKEKLVDIYNMCVGKLDEATADAVNHTYNAISKP